MAEELKKDKYRNVFIGALAVFSVLVVFWGVNFLKGEKLLASRNQYTILYSDASGLGSTSTVVINGFVVGGISQISLDMAGEKPITVVISVESSIQIPRGSQARIASTDLLGAKSIEIVPAAGADFHVSGDTLASGDGVDLMKSLMPLKENAEALLSELSTLALNVNRAFDSQAADAAKEALLAAREASRSVAALSAELDALMRSNAAQADSTLKALAEVSTAVAGRRGQIEATIDNLAATSSMLASDTLATALAQLNVALGSTARILNQVESEEGTLGKLAGDDSLYNQLVTLTTTLESLMSDIQANPKRYVNFSLFGGKSK